MSSSRLLNELIPLFSFVLAWIAASRGGGIRRVKRHLEKHASAMQREEMRFDVETRLRYTFVGTLGKGGGVRWIYELPWACLRPDTRAFERSLLHEDRIRGGRALRAEFRRLSSIILRFNRSPGRNYCRGSVGSSRRESFFHLDRGLLCYWHELLLESS